MMRRKDREITEINEILSVMDRCKVCRLGICENGSPYIVPLNFGYSFDNGILSLYFHCAHEGKKIDIIRKNSRACFELDCDHKMIPGECACKYGFAFSSVIGFGEIGFISDKQEKIRALDKLMKHQTGNDITHEYNESEIDRVTVLKMTVNDFTCKQKTV